MSRSLTLQNRYDIQPGTRIQFRGGDVTVIDRHGDDYTVYDAHTESKVVWSNSYTSAAMSDFGTKITSPNKMQSTSSRTQPAASYLTFHKNVQDDANFKLALCVAMHELLATAENCQKNRDGIFTQWALDQCDLRESICQRATEIFGAKISQVPSRSGKTECWTPPKGKTLQKLLRLHMKHSATGNVMTEISSLHHMRGNRTPRIPEVVTYVMHQSIQEVWMNGMKKSVANVQTDMWKEIHKLNINRSASRMDCLTVPSQMTIRNYIKSHFPKFHQDISRNGAATALNFLSYGERDLPAVHPGELVEIDECKLSIIALFEASGIWEKLSPKQRKMVSGIDNNVKARPHLVLAIDAATRMPLGWTVTLNPSTDATLEVLRQVTGDKRAMAAKYGCRSQPAPPVGIGQLSHDNGTALRNTTVISACAMLGITTMAARAGRPTDKPVIERKFRAFQSELLPSFSGYTGTLEKKLTNYNAVKAASLLVEDLLAMFTRYLVDIYPHQPHGGIGLNGKSPLQAWSDAAEQYGSVQPVDPATRLLALGSRETRTPNSEGIYLSDSVFFNSPALQVARNTPGFPTKVTLHYDPSCLQHAVVSAVGHPDPIHVHLTTTYLADLSLDEVKRIIVRARHIAPHDIKLRDDIIYKAWGDIDQANDASLRHYQAEQTSQSQGQMRAAAREILGMDPDGQGLSNHGAHNQITAPGTVMNLAITGPTVMKIHEDGCVDHEEPAAPSAPREIAQSEVDADLAPQPPTQPKRTPRKQQPAQINKKQPLPRPTKLSGLE